MISAYRSPYGHDHSAIDSHHDDEIGYWAVMLNCKVTELRAAISTVGPVVCDVDNYLRRLKALGFRI
jgi:hypothetical protein